MEAPPEINSFLGLSICSYVTVSLDVVHVIMKELTMAA